MTGVWGACHPVRDILGTQVTVMSAGFYPADAVHPGAIAVMQEIDIDISSAKPKTHEDLPLNFLANLDYVITVCEQEICPQLTARKECLRWQFPDPILVKGKEQTALFRSIRAQLTQKILDFGRQHQLLA